MEKIKPAASPETVGQSSGKKSPLRLRVRPAAESVIRSRHPWLFAESVRDQNRPGVSGELAVIYDRNDRFLAFGLYDPESIIRVRILHTGKPRPADLGFWIERMEQAAVKREPLFDSHTTGFRWINGESDGWPGLVLDRYDTTLVIKLYTAAWLPWLEQIVATIVSRLHPQRIVLRLSRNAQKRGALEVSRSDGTVIYGSPLQEAVQFEETGLRFEADVLKGQKTGFFLDQRENRRKIERLARGRSVLNTFSFSGAFSVYAARGQAQAVTDLDISPHALTTAGRNFALNKQRRAEAVCEQERIQADCFEWLEANASRQFDLVILDPPSMAKRESEREGAILAYRRLTALGLQHLKPAGVLLACSCSAHVTQEQFYEAVRGSLLKSKRRFEEIARTGEPPDHPANIPEARYLKAVYIRMT
jgi:23S rRNA (cytosine1962-C5)-methyltransferase